MVRLFRVSIPAAAILLALVEAVLIPLCYIAASFFSLTNEGGPWFYFFYDDGWLQLLLVMMLLQGGLYFANLYGDLRTFGHTNFVQKLCLIMGIAFLAQAVIGYGAWDVLQLPQWTMVYGSGLVVLVLPAWRYLFFSLIREALPSRRLLLIGSSPVLDEIIREVKTRPEMGISIVHHRADLDEYTQDPVVQGSTLHSIVVAQGGRDHLPMQSLIDSQLAAINIQDAATLYETLFGRVPLENLPLSPATLEHPPQPRPWALQLQRLYSTVLAAGLLVLASPLYLAITAALALSGGRVLVGERRVGLYGRPFTLYRFACRNRNGRLTGIGSWLQSWNGDKLPYLISVLAGNMALVGPSPKRAALLEYVHSTVWLYSQRQVARPGITGWAQINQDSREVLNALTELEYDLYYIKHLDPALDLYILLHTLRAAFFPSR
jgi:lipopolysaccharide/colanic/teichoic acid biosynthesis glycosyltransferase